MTERTQLEGCNFKCAARVQKLDEYFAFARVKSECDHLICSFRQVFKRLLVCVRRRRTNNVTAHRHIHMMCAAPVSIYLYVCVSASSSIAASFDVSHVSQFIYLYMLAY